MIYTIHKRNDSIMAVEEKINYSALLFTPIWLMWHRLWMALALYVLLIAIVVAVQSTAYAFLTTPLLLFPSLYLFLEGSQLRRYSLTQKGYVLADIVDASDSEAAMIKASYRR